MCHSCELLASLVADRLVPPSASIEHGRPTKKEIICYEAVTRTKIIRVPYFGSETRYDSSGQSYTESVFLHKDVELLHTELVPVKKTVPLGS